MTQMTRFIAGDWGTSNLRLYLCEYKPAAAAKILDTRFGSGISQIKGDFEDKFFELAQDWFEQWGEMPVLLSGMVGSTIGWKDAPYLSCPVDAAQIAAGRLEFNCRGISFSILAGLRTQNPLGAPDVMRGEELQMLGWLRLQKNSKSDNNSGKSKRLFALPGTHNKWTLVENGAITNFLTAFTGELFSLLSNHSILIAKPNVISFNQTAFIDGVDAINSLGDAQLLHALFATRSKQVLGEMASADASSYLSGLIIGADVMGASKLFGKVDGVTIIGEPSLTQNYALALEYFGVSSERCDPSKIAISGFEAIFEQLHEKHEHE
ncbi:MAG: 2-dehydro-3-deoxygalactonokinase [Arenicella sp.]|jgi:2-dehydro-3-deoxygalactonokinase